MGITGDGAGNSYVAEGNRIRKVASSGETTTLAGNGTVGFIHGSGGEGGATAVHGPEGVARDRAANLYVAHTGNNRIRKVAPDGTTTMLAGTGSKTAPLFNDGVG